MMRKFFSAIIEWVEIGMTFKYWFWYEGEWKADRKHFVDFEGTSVTNNIRLEVISSEYSGWIFFDIKSGCIINKQHN